MQNVFLARILVPALLLVLVYFVWFGETGTGTFFGSGACDEGALCVTFLDVGQGDAIFIESPSGVQMLIDGGPGNGVLRELSRYMGFFDRKIDVLLATHPDQDHIGGLVDVLKRYEVGMIILTENKSETPVSESFNDLVQDEESMVVYARGGQVIDLGEGALLHVLFPDRDPELLESNASSIISRLVYGNTEFLFTGDSPKGIEKYLVSLYGTGLESDVLKVGHHGSKTSTAEMFISAVDPTYAIISAGKDNRYGHPHKDVTDILRAAGIQIKNTADSGSISIISDGEGVFLK